MRSCAECTNNSLREATCAISKVFSPLIVFKRDAIANMVSFHQKLSMQVDTAFWRCLRVPARPFLYCPLLLLTSNTCLKSAS